MNEVEFENDIMEESKENSSLQIEWSILPENEEERTKLILETLYVHL
jgi:hypothetical protein